MSGCKTGCTNFITALFYLSAHHSEEEDEDSSNSGHHPVHIAIRGITSEAGAVLLAKHCIAAIEV